MQKQRLIKHDDDGYVIDHSLDDQHSFPLSAKRSTSSIHKFSNRKRDPTRKDGTIDMLIRDQIKELMSIGLYKRMLFLVGFYMLPTSMLQVFLVPYGAAWFADCDTDDVMHSDEDDCDFDYDAYVFWDSLSLTAMGVISFLFSGFLGRASDSFGRKPFLILTFIIGLINRGVMVFTDNLWIFFGLRLLYGMNGGRDAQTPVMNAYYSDVLPPYLKTIGYGLSYAVAGLMLFLGAAISTSISLLLKAEYNWTAISIVYIGALIYIGAFVPESLKFSNRKQFSIKNFNPIRPLLHVADNKIVLWMSVIQFLISLPQGGIIGIILVYLSETMGINDDQESSVINAIFLVSVGSSGILCAAVVLPILKRHFTDLVIAEIGIVGSVIGQLIFALFYWLPYIPVIVCGGLLYFCVGISNAALNSILTRFLSAKEQGQGFGIIQSYRAITTIISPLSFAIGYRESKKDPLNLPNLPFMISATIILSALLFTRFALKKQIAEQKLQASPKKGTIDIHDGNEGFDMDKYENNNHRSYDAIVHKKSSQGHHPDLSMGMVGVTTKQANETDQTMPM